MCGSTRTPTAIFFSPIGCLLPVLVASHGQGGTAEWPDTRELLQAPAALALGRHARGLRTDAGGADDDTGDLHKQRTGGESGCEASAASFGQECLLLGGGRRHVQYCCICRSHARAACQEMHDKRSTRTRTPQ